MYNLLRKFLWLGMLKMQENRISSARKNSLKNTISISCTMNSKVSCGKASVLGATAGCTEYPQFQDLQQEGLVEGDGLVESGGLEGVLADVGSHSEGSKNKDGLHS